MTILSQTLLFNPNSPRKIFRSGASEVPYLRRSMLPGVGCNNVEFNEYPPQVEAPPIDPGRQVVRIGGPVVLLTQTWAYGYFHWLIETLPRLMLVYGHLMADHRMVLVAGSGLTSFMSEYLDLLGLSRQTRTYPIYEQGRHPVIIAPRMLVPAPIPCGCSVPRLLIELRDTLFARLASRGQLDEPRPPDTIVVIRRTDTRSVTNHDEVMQTLRKELGHRLRVTEFCGDSLPRTINLFRAARLVVGPHGAGLSNMIYSARGTPIVEFQMEVPNGCYLALASTLGMPYWGFRVPGATQTGPMQVNVTTLMERVRGALGPGEPL
ncbi:hypothetical protein PAPYR_11777 [Paratrimastix pyriformis]|uniref:Glycosyltransferase 61 catalytic domain-containing protein n=1 Tax=Paratrimastix pyriformis TaxID=342808 RepID=A0ABQ8U7W4_9EUKA|nr:hypothetical protein PAPYR_11777 [Paratrimastix pyriformis]